MNWKMQRIGDTPALGGWNGGLRSTLSAKGDIPSSWEKVCLLFSQKSEWSIIEYSGYIPSRRSYGVCPPGR